MDMDFGAMRDFGISLLVASIFTPVVRLVALKVGWTHRPNPRKWRRKSNPHAIPIAMGGGFAMLAGFVAATTLNFNLQLLLTTSFAFCAAMLGFYDDMKSPPPIYRLTIQTLFGIATVFAIGWIHGLPIWLSIPITIFGLVGLMNSVNMMDNMDGVASGLMTLSMLGYALLGWLTHNELVTILSLAVAGASLGFWVYNKPPAIIFMGDTGSLMLGYLLAVVGIMASWGEFPHLFGRLFAPLLLATVFITDTTFVVLWRWRHGLPVMRGDRNHTSHRLAVWLGSEWKANIALYALQVLMGLLAIAVALTPIFIAASLTLLAFGLLGIYGAKLWQVKMD